MEKRLFLMICFVGVSVCAGQQGNAADRSRQSAPDINNSIQGLTGQVSKVHVFVPVPEEIKLVADTQPAADLDLKRMGQWAMNYLINTPRKEYNYEPLFQCHPLQCPPIPDKADPVVACDTDARMDWEWYFMRDVSGSDAGRDIEALFHKRIRNYIDANGTVLAPPGCYSEGETDKVWKKEDYIIHTWGMTKILKSLSEDYIRTKNPESKELARKVMLGAKRIAVWDANGHCYFRQGMGALNLDGTVRPNGWNAHPAPIVEPLVTYYLATGDLEGLEFARAYAEGIMNHSQPDGVVFKADGSFLDTMNAGTGHSHATMHALWGIAHLGLIENNQRYLDFVEKTWQHMLRRGTGTGWFPASPDSCNETCCVSDMMSIASIFGFSGKTEYFDCVERYMRNYISNLQFIVTPEFEAYYRSIHKDKTPQEIESGLAQLRKFQGGIIGGSGINDYENVLLGGVSGFQMFGCCAPEGMRAIYTTWSSVINSLPASPLGPKGIYVNMCFDRESPWGRVMSFFPQEGRMTVVPSVKDTFFLRPPHWAPRGLVRAFVGTKPVEVVWSGNYVRFDAKPNQEITIAYPLISFSHKVSEIWPVTAPNLKMKFEWLGNMVVSVDPAATKTPLFLGKPRLLPAIELNGLTTK
jgi:hypothetical protein